MISNYITLCSSKTNLSFFKKRLNGNSILCVTSPSNNLTSKDQPTIPNSQKETEKKMTLDFEKKIKNLENYIEQDQITMEKIKELLELYAVKYQAKL